MLLSVTSHAISQARRNATEETRMQRALSRESSDEAGIGWHGLRFGSVLLCLVMVLVVGLEAEAASVIRHGSRERPWVALTFDDGWSADRCGQIVRTLRAKRATATFFINGSVIRRDPSQWRRMLSGFAVANHTLTHAWLNRLSATRVRAEIRTNEQAIEHALRRPMLRLLRPPYGAYDNQVLGIAKGLGYHTVLWDTDSGDTRPGATRSSVIHNAIRGGRGAIVLLHCGPSVTPSAVGPIIDSYRSRGYKLVDLGKMLGLAPPRKACRVRNIDSGKTRTSLQKAVEAARAGDRLTVRGICRGLSTVGKDLAISGIRTKGSGEPTLAGMDRGTVVSIPAGVSVTIGALTIRAGASKQGGGIVNRGALKLRNVVVRGNRATGAGGGIINSGSLELAGTSSVRSNTAKAQGGGIANSGTLTMSGSSSVTGNSAASPGGGVASSGTLVGVVCGGNVRHNQPDDCAGS